MIWGQRRQKGMKKLGFLLVFIAVGILIFSSIGVALTPQEKIQYISAASTSAREAMQDKEQGQARMVMLAVLKEVQSLAPAASQSPVKELFDGYMQARNLAWPDAPAALSMDQVSAFLAAFEKNKTELLFFSKDMNISTLPNGKQQYYEYIADILSMRKTAWEKIGALAMLSPPPDQLLSSNQVFMKLFQDQILTMFFNVAFGPAVAVEHAQQKVIPDNIKIAQEAIAAASVSQDPSTIWHKLGQADSALRLIESIEANLKGEVDVSALTVAVPEMQKKVKAEYERAQQLYDKQIDSNRMPAAVGWQGGNEGAVIEQIKKSYHAAFPSEKILKVSLQSSDFGERWESWWEEDVLYTGYFGYVKVAIAAKQKDGDCRVFFKWFRRDRKADGGWSDLYLQDTIGSYRIREKNI